MKPVMIETGTIVGPIAAAALSAIMLVMKQSMGLMPDLDAIALIAAMAGASSLVVGWIDHFVIGAVFWEVDLAIISPHLPGPPWLCGAIFASRGLRRSIVVMPTPACLGGVLA